jgi:ElaB/YqjD/DUF883 family membrane-anchored ribosome-binding protein
MDTKGSEAVPFDAQASRDLPRGMRQVATRLREMGGPSLRAARDRLARVGDDMRIEARSTAYAAERYARQKPWRVAGAAALLALITGYLIGLQASRTSRGR